MADRQSLLITASGNMGLPTVRTPIVERNILESLAKGHTATMACAMAGISRSSYEKWRREDKRFLANCDQAKAMSASEYFDVVHESALNNVSDAKYMLERHPMTREQFSGNSAANVPAVAVQFNIGRGDDTAHDD